MATYNEMVVRSGISDKDRKDLLETRLLRADHELIGTPDYSVKRPVEEMQGKEIAELRSRLKGEKDRIGRLLGHITLLETQITNVLRGDPNDDEILL